MSNHFELITDAATIAETAERIAKVGLFCMDLEFASADRYIPELALVQLGWHEGDELRMVLIETLETDLSPLATLVESPNVRVVAHGAKQDLSLLARRWGVSAQNFYDTQIAAAFAGIAEQIGYGNLVQEVTGKKLDKGSQFTDWLRRPLSDSQLRYALDDVRYLLPVYHHLQRALDKLGRTNWALEESAMLAELAVARPAPEEIYLSVGGQHALKPRARGALRELMSWREETALEANLPPSWILPDAACVEACRKGARSEKDLKKLKGVSGGSLKKYGDEILAAIAEGMKNPEEGDEGKAQLSPVAQAQVGIVTAIVASAGAKLGMPARSIGAKADAEALVRHALGEPVACKLLEGWRREVVGSTAVDWLQGRAHLLADPERGVEVVSIG